LGFGALLAVAAVVAVMLMPGLSTRIEYLPLYARSTYHKLFPPPPYLPTPAPTVASITATQNRPVATVDPPALIDDIPVVSISATPRAEPAILTPSAQPEAAPSRALPSATSLPTADLPPPLPATLLSGLTHQWQTWNNCGPATITMNLSYFGRTETQVEAAQFLKPNRDDKNVSPHELAAYARSVGLKAMVRQGGSLPELKAFLSTGFPVLAETWLVHEGDGLGHYRLVIGYDEATRSLATFDSLNGPGYTVSYEQFDADWRVFNRLYVLAYPPEQEEIVAAILGPQLDDATMYEGLVSQARSELAVNPNDAIAYFNLGEALTRLDRYEEATTAFDRARQLGLHWRRLWYQFAPFEAYYAVERYQDVLDLAEATLASTGGLEEVYLYQGLAWQATGQSGAADAFEAALAYNPNFTPAREALEQLQ
jgi:tetratricopeptide (TPR) repeat protein